MNRPSAIALALLTLWARSAAADELWKGEDEKSVLELQGFYKSLGEYLALPNGLVQTANKAQALIPGSTPCPGGPACLPSSAGMATNTLRVWGRLALWGELTLDAGWEVAATTATPALGTGNSALGGGVSAGDTTAVAPGRRLVDFSPNLLDQSGNGLLIQHNLDLLSVRIPVGKGELVVGRQVLSWGTGRFWNPTDLLSPFAPSDFDKEVRHGIDAVSLALPLSETSLVDVIWLPQQKAADQGGVVRAQTNLAGYDFSISVAKYASDIVFGADTAGDIGPLGAHAEAGYTLGLSGLDSSGPITLSQQFLRAVAGLDWKPASGWMVTGEYYYNGFGATNPAQYFLKMRDPLETSGEVFGAAQHYVGVAAAWKTTELLTLNASLIANVRDPSAILFPVAEYWFEQHVLVRFGAYIPLGKQPDPRAVTNVQNAAALGLRSEYGASPAGLFAQVGLHF